MRWKELVSSRNDVLEEMRKQSPYEILRLDPYASQDEAKKAYIKLISTYHPDKSHRFLRRTNEEIAKLINAAYESIVRQRNGQ
ncbi:MAG: DnaJ domain-containing protein [Chloroflexi bacterium]|nr:DnaJ domain-containing protein [Chloroflexota bacterium]